MVSSSGVVTGGLTPAEENATSTASRGLLVRSRNRRSNSCRGERGEHGEPWSPCQESNLLNLHRRQVPGIRQDKEMEPPARVELARRPGRNRVPFRWASEAWRTERESNPRATVLQTGLLIGESAQGVASVRRTRRTWASPARVVTGGLTNGGADRFGAGAERGRPQRESNSRSRLEGPLS